MKVLSAKKKKKEQHNFVATKQQEVMHTHRETERETMAHQKSIAGYKFIDHPNLRHRHCHGILLHILVSLKRFSHLVFIHDRYGYYIINCLSKDFFFHFMTSIQNNVNFFTSEDPAIQMMIGVEFLFFVISRRGKYTRRSNYVCAMRTFWSYCFGDR